MKITNAISRAVYDSNGYPTIEVIIVTNSGMVGRSLAIGTSNQNFLDPHSLQKEHLFPSLRSMNPALEIFEKIVKPAILGEDCSDQKKIDSILEDLDETKRKKNIGINNIVATSTAVAKVGSKCLGIPLHEHLKMICGDKTQPRNLLPIFNILDGAKHRMSGIYGIEFLLIPSEDMKLEDSLEMTIRILHKVKKILWDKGEIFGLGEQGGLLVNLPNCEKSFELIISAAESCGYNGIRDFYLGVDMGTNRFLNKKGYKFNWEGLKYLDPEKLMEFYSRWVESYPLLYIEDPFTNNDTRYWELFYEFFSDKTFIIGDDLFASSCSKIYEMYSQKLTNAFLVKQNRIGTVSRTLKTIKKCQALGLISVISHRTRENDDSFITSLAYATNSHFLKAGGLSKMDRIIKYNELLRLHSSIDDHKINMIF